MLTFTRRPSAPSLEEQTQEEETLRRQIETAILPPTRLISRVRREKVCSVGYAHQSTCKLHFKSCLGICGFVAENSSRNFTGEDRDGARRL